MPATTTTRDAARVPISGITAHRANGVSRVVADVAGSPVWFESPDVELVASPEAFGSLMLIPALHAGARVELDGAVDPAWASNMRALTSTLHRWWRYPAWAPDAPATNGAAPAATPGVPDDAPRALFFSGGVDSFHVLLRGGVRVDRIVSLQGFDYPVGDQVRAAAVEASVRDVAARTGTPAVIVRTNAREHPLLAGSPWERIHGGVLAAVGHLLAGVTPRIAISASAPGDLEVPWGSHWQIDALWSSSRVAFEHVGRGSQRVPKIRDIALEAVVRDHLRVCWKNQSPTGNCSRCNKCVFVMLVLEDLGELVHSGTFTGRDELAERVAGLRRTPDRIVDFERLAKSSRFDPAVVAAIRAFTRRSRHALRPDVRLRRAVVRWFLMLTGNVKH